MKGVPDEVVFCDALTPGEPQITYGNLRCNTDDLYRLRCLQVRIESWLIKQCQVMQKGDSCPFPLVVTTLVGIGSLSEVFYRDRVPSDLEDRNRQLFSTFCSTLDQKLATTLKKDFKESFAERWSVEKPSTLSGLLYTFFRNSLLHGYYGRAVFITGDDTDDVDCDSLGFVRLNPYWLFERFVCSARKHTEGMLREKSKWMLASKRTELRSSSTPELIGRKSDVKEFV